MAYVSPNFKTKKQLKEAVKNGELVYVFSPNGDLFGDANKDGVKYIEGPHYPRPHSWYAQVTVKDGVVQSVK